MGALDHVTDPVVDGARRVYTDHLRKLIAAQLLRGGERTLTRRELLEDPPLYLAELQFADEAETVRLKKPPGVGPLPKTINEKVGEWTFDRPFVATLQDIQLVGPNALPIASDGRYVTEAAAGSSRRVSDELVRTLAAGKLPARRESADRTLETVVPLAGPWSEEFFHWFADYLPRLRSLHRRYGNLHDAPPLLIPGNPPDWLRASLDLLGVDESQRIPWPGGRVTVRRLVLPSLPRHTDSTAPEEGYIQSPRALTWVADRLQSATDSSDRPNVGRRLYVSRVGESDRAVVNEAEIRPTLKAAGFDIVRPDEWTLREQIAAFADAEAVCGPHGGGLVNFIYADDAVLLELFGERTNPCYYGIAAGMSQRYAAHHATAVGDHLHVDTEKLSMLLAMVDDWPQASSDSK